MDGHEENADQSQNSRTGEALLNKVTGTWLSWVRLQHPPRDPERGKAVKEKKKKSASRSVPHGTVNH